METFYTAELRRTTNSRSSSDRRICTVFTASALSVEKWRLKNQIWCANSITDGQSSMKLSRRRRRCTCPTGSEQPSAHINRSKLFSHNLRRQSTTTSTSRSMSRRKGSSAVPLHLRKTWKPSTSCPTTVSCQIWLLWLTKDSKTTKHHSKLLLSGM